MKCAFSLKRNVVGGNKEDNYSIKEVHTPTLTEKFRYGQQIV